MKNKSSLILVLIMLITMINSSLVIVNAEGYAMTIDKTTYKIGEDIVVNFSGSSSSRDWIGICYESAPQYQGNTIDVWLYTNSDTQYAGTNIKESGTVTFKAEQFKLEPGEYAMFMMLNDGYQDVAEAHFVVEDSSEKPDKPLEVKYQRSATKDYFASGKITVTPPEKDSEINGFDLYWADENGKLSSYTKLGYIKYVKGEAAEYQIPEGAIFPMGVKNIIAYTVAGTKISDDYASASLGQIEILNPSELLYSFNVLSDTHITTDASHTYNKNFDRALKDILNANPDSRAIFITGDNTNYGYEEEWKEFKSIVDKNKNGLPNIYSTLGNHDLWKGETYDGLVDLFKQYTGATAPYYSVEIEGNTFIVLGSQSKADETGGYANLKADQIKWLKETLEKASASENAIFVFMHQPLKDTTSGTLTKIDPKIQSWHGVTQDSEIRKLFDKYPNLLFFTGHTHWKFDSIQPFLPGNGKGANYLNNASVAYLWNDADSESPGSQGYSVEVYKDYILVRGREISNGEWAANAQFLIPISKSANNDESNIAESVGSVSNGNSINESNVTTDNNSKDGYITWIIAGGVVLMVAVVLIIIKLKKLR